MFHIYSYWPRENPYFSFIAKNSTETIFLHVAHGTEPRVTFQCVSLLPKK